MAKDKFTEKDLVSFGEYLLSEKREQSLKQSSAENKDMPPYDERKRYVHDADLQNWLIAEDAKNTTANQK